MYKVLSLKRRGQIAQKRYGINAEERWGHLHKVVTFELILGKVDFRRQQVGKAGKRCPVAFSRKGISLVEM